MRPLTSGGTASEQTESSDLTGLFVDTAGTKATYTSLEDAIASRAPGTFYVSDLGVQSGVERIDLFRRGELRTIFR